MAQFLRLHKENRGEMQNCLRKLGVKCNIYSWEVEKYKLVVDDQRRSPEMFVDKDSFLDGKCRYEKLSWTFMNLFFSKMGRNAS